MKRFGKFLILFIFSLSLFLCSNFFEVKTQEVSADTEDITLSNYNYYNLEYALFKALLNLENEVKGGIFDTGFSPSFFSTGFETASPTSPDGIAIKSDLQLGILNLTIGENSPYECLQIQSELISDINGLNEVDLSGVTTLILDDNNISNISNSDLSTITDINIVSICNNSLSSFSINPVLSGKITQLYLRNNLLSQVDLSSLALNAEIDLADNYFENFSDISFGGTVAFLDLSNNNITTEPNIPFSFGCTPIFLMQGLKKETFKAGDKIVVVNDNVYVLGLVVHIKYFAGDDEISASEYYVNSNDIVTSASNIGFNQIELPAGKLSISFSFETNLDIPEENETYFADKYIASKLPAPKVVATSNGNTITSYSQNSAMNFSFSLDISSNLYNKSQIETDAVIYSGENGSEEENISTYALTTYASKTLSSYFVFDGIVGDKIRISVSYTQASNPTLALILIVLIFVVISSVVYIIRWIRNGTPITPLSDVEKFKEMRRQDKKQLRTDSPNYDGDEVIDLSTEASSESEETIEQNEKENTDDIERGRYRK